MTEPQEPRDFEPDAGAPADADADARQPLAGDGGEAVGGGSAREADLESRAAELQDKYLRLAAEFDNFRKRAAREREQSEHHGQGVVIRGLLDGLDDLGRFADLDPWNTEVETVIDGVRMVEQKLLKSLSGHGLEVIDPAGTKFDPNLHEAVSTAPASGPDEDHQVAEVFQVGYVFNGRLLRPARVVVKQWTA
jgi:molecular chaperone GrpE